MSSSTSDEREQRLKEIRDGIANGWQTCGVAPNDPRMVQMKFETSEAAKDFVDRMANFDLPLSLLDSEVAGDEINEVIRQYLRDHALSPRAPLPVDGEAVCVCVICQFAREVMQPVFAKDRAELDRVLVEAVRDDPVGVRLTELQLERESREGSFSAPSPSSVPPEQKHLCPHCGRRMQSDFDEDVGMWYECQNCDYREAVSNAATPAPVEQEQPFQSRVQPWMMVCFGAQIAADKEERNHRFLEEALELVQACGATRSEAHQLVDYTFDRPTGTATQEVGGVMVTLAALCLAQGFDMHECGETELTRIWSKVETIRAKQAAKPKHSPLPEHVATPSPSLAAREAAKDGATHVSITVLDRISAQFQAYWDRHPEEKERAAANPVTEVEEYVNEVINAARWVSPVPAAGGDEDRAARWTDKYAEGIESQNDVTEATRIENWSDFHAGQVFAAKQIATGLRNVKSDSVGEEGK